MTVTEDLLDSCIGHQYHPASHGSVLLLLLLVLMQSVVSRVSGCQEADFALCKVTSNSSLGPVEGSLLAFTNDTLEAMCISHKRMASCFEDVRRSCPHYSTANFEGTNQALEFLCGEGRQEYDMFKHCFAHPGLALTSTTCGHSFHNRTNALLLLPGTLEDKTKKLCKYISQFLRCVKDTVSSYCGSEQARWMYTFKKHVMHHTIVNVRCTEGFFDVPALLGLAIGTMVGAVVIVLSALICRQRILRTLHRGTASFRRRSGISTSSNNTVSLRGSTKVPRKSRKSSARGVAGGRKNSGGINSKCEAESLIEDSKPPGQIICAETVVNIENPTPDSDTLGASNANNENILIQAGDNYAKEHLVKENRDGRDEEEEVAK